MEELLQEIFEQIDVFTENADKHVRGNKSAGARARKASLNIEKLFKAYRRESILNDKKD